MKPTIRFRSFLTITGSSLLAMSSANAATLTWDADSGTSGAQDGGGNWTVGGTTFWNGAANVATTNNITTDIAQFGNGGTLASQATVNVSTQSINGLIFGATTTNGYNLTASSVGQTLTLGANGVTVNSGAQATNVGSANLGITLGAGQTWKNGSTGLLSITGNVNNGGNLLTIGDSTNHGSVNIGGVISGAGGITVGSRSRVVLGDANEFTGAITLQGFGSGGSGTIAFTSIADFGSTTANSLGKVASGSIKLGNGSSSIGRLEYIGTTNSESNRTIEIVGTATNAGQILNNGTGTIKFDATTFNVNNGTGAHSLLLSGSNTGDNEISGIITNGVTSGAAVLSLNKTGAGKWILSGGNTYGGTTTASGTGKLILSGANTPGASATVINDGGELVLDYTSQDNAKIGTGTLSLNGGTVTLKGIGSSHAQTVASTSLGGTGTFITRSSGGSSLNLGTFTTITRGSSLSISEDNVATSNRTNTNGILGGNFVVGNNWAVNSTNGAAGAIVGLSTYTALPTSGFSDTTNYSLTGSLTLAGSGTVNTLKIIASADGQTLAMGTRNLLATNIGNSAGYLFTANDDSYTYNITGTGNMRTALANQDTFFFVNNGTLNLTARTGSGTGAVIKAGSGTLILGGDNGSTGSNHSGVLAVQQGTLRLTHNNGAGQTGGGITVQNLAALELANSVAIGAEALTITGTGVANAGALRNVASNTSSYAGAITIGVNGARINSDTDGSLTLTNGIVTAAGRSVTFGGAGNITVSTAAISGAGGLIKDGDGTLTLSAGLTNTYTGATNVNDGTLIVNGNISSSSLTTVAIGATLGGSGTVGATIVNGTLSVGNSPGQMDFTNTLALAGNTIMEVDGIAGPGVLVGGHDFVNLTGAGAAGALTYGGMMTLDFGSTYAAGSYSWNLFDFASETSTFTGITLADQYSGSLLDADLNGIWDLNSGNNTWVFTESSGILGLTVTAIPEPSTALLGGLGVFGLLLRRRR